MVSYFDCPSLSGNNKIHLFPTTSEICDMHMLNLVESTNVADRPALQLPMDRTVHTLTYTHTHHHHPFIVLTETKSSYSHIPVWARYSPHQTRVEAHANMFSP